MLTTFTDGINDTLYIEEAASHSSSNHSFDNNHLLNSSISFSDHSSFNQPYTFHSNDTSTSNDESFLFNINDFSRYSIASDSFSVDNIDHSFDLNTNHTQTPGPSSFIAGQGQSSESSSLRPFEQHKPLFGAHPLLIPFQEDAASFSPPNNTIFSGGSAAPLTSTPFNSTSGQWDSEIDSDEEDLDVDSQTWIALPDSKLLQVQCGKCGQVINTGSTARNIGPLKAHRKGKKCKKMRAKSRNGISTQCSEMRAATCTRSVLFPKSIANKENIPNTAAPTLSQPEQTVVFEVTTPSKIRKEYSDCNVESDTEDNSDNDTLDNITFESRRPPFTPISGRNMSKPSTSSVEFTNNDVLSHLHCPGVALNWPLPKFFASYPFARHEDTDAPLNYHFCRIGAHSRDFWIRSLSCKNKRSSNFEACAECRKLPATISHLASVASHAAPGTNYKYLSSIQMQNVTREKDNKVRAIRLDVLNLKRRCATVMSNQDEHRRFLDAVSKFDITRLRQLVRQCIKQKAGIKQILQKIEDSVAKVYHVRGYDQIDFDTALLCYRLGSRSLLYSMSKRFSLPSLRTLTRSQTFTRLLPSHSTPTVDEIIHNLNEVLRPYLDSAEGSEPYTSGISIFWDEINEEDSACYFPHSDSVGGLCREHSAGVDLRLKTYDSAVCIAKALADDSVHYGKEGSVIAIGSFGSKLVGALPIAISPTCKSETPEESGGIFLRVVDAYKQQGANLRFGPVWSFSSDGDSGRRQMCHKILVKNEVVREHTLFKFVGRLLGLNRFIGDDDITADIDWKHLIKRDARLLRTVDGLIVNDTLINRDIIIRHLHYNPELGDLKIHQLMNPTDAQDVPRAIELLKAVAAINLYAPDQCSPTEQHELAALRVIGEMFLAFLDAFTQVDWTLGQQITSLSKFAHISFALFHRHRVNFMPNQLYIDSQTTVKNVIFCVAKQKDLDDTQPFYLFLTGDDRLENLFGRIRMQGGHNPNCSFKQLVDRAGAAVDITNIFSRNPALDTGHRRLKITRTEHLDHLNKESWRGCATVGSMDLYNAWTAGQEAAKLSLASLNISEDFEEVLRRPQTDLMRPFGDGHYPGVSDATEPDRSQLQSKDQSCQGSGTLNTELPTTSLEDYSSQMESFLSDEGGNNNPEVEQYENTYIYDDEELSTFFANEADNDNLEDVDLDDLTDVPSELQLPTANNISEEKVSPFLNVPNAPKPVHKSSICRILINPGFGRKSHERVLRVRGYTSETKPSNLNTDNIIDSNTFLVGDLFASIIRCDNRACFALMKCVAIEEKGTRTEQADGRNFQYPASKITLYGQILVMNHVGKPQAPSPMGNSTQDVPTIEIHSNSTDDSKEFTWIWTGFFAKLDLNARSKTLKGKAARKTLVVKCASHLCTVVNPRLLEVEKLASSDKADLSTTLTLTWEIRDDELDVIIEKLWQSVKASNGLGSLPFFLPNSNFPYKNVNGEMTLISEEGSVIIASQKSVNPNKTQCYQCLAYVEASQMRDHVGRHILKALRQVPEVLWGQPITGDFPCGFCGRSGIATCSELFLTKVASMQAKSNCVHFTKFRYQPALTSTSTTPCTNVPVICTLPSCSKATQEGYSAIWKYNMIAHIRAEHPGYNTDAANEGLVGLVQLPNELLTAIFISDEEEERMKIPKDKIPMKLVPSLMNDIPARLKGTNKRKAAALSAGSTVSKRRK